MECTVCSAAADPTGLPMKESPFVLKFDLVIPSSVCRWTPED